MASVKRFEDLVCWQKARELTKFTYGITKGEQFAKDYGLKDQIQRASVSVMSNIAEGFARKHAKEYKQFLYVCLGSCAELETQIEIAADQNYIDGQKKADLIEKIECLCRMTMSLSKCL